MNDSTLYRLSAAACLLSGVCIIVGKALAFLDLVQAGEVLDFFSPLCGLFAITGVYLKRRRRVGRFGCAAFATFFTGLTLVVCLDYFGAFMRLQLPEEAVNNLLESSSSGVFIASGLIFIAGVVMFGISSFIARVFPRPASVLFVIGFVVVPLYGIVSRDVVAAGSVLAGIGIIWWGLALWRMLAEA